MPTVTPYTGSAAGNGFPLCLERVNIADRGDGQPFDKWSTLGGTNKGNVAGLSAAQKKANISRSWQHAWRLYWKSYALNYTLELSGSGDASGSINVVDDNSNQPPGGVAPGVEIIDRLCENEFTSQTNNTTNGKGVAFGYPSSDFYVGFRSTGSAVPIVRMYNGATTNEANFVGYGVRSNYLDFMADGAFPEPPTAGIFAPFYDEASGLAQYMVLQSYFDQINAATDARFAYDPDESSYGYTNLPISGSTGTISFASAFVYYGEGTVVLDAKARSALEEVGLNDNKTVIKSIEFYNQ